MSVIRIRGVSLIACGGEPATHPDRRTKVAMTTAEKIDLIRRMIADKP
jgi:hypothetical protein